MKRSLALFLTLASVFALSAVAQTPAAPAPAGPAKIAVIFFQAALAQTNEGQRAFADLQKKYEPKRVQFKNLSDEIDSLTKQLQTQGDKLSDAERAAAPGPSTTRRRRRSASARTRRTTSNERCKRFTAAWPPRSARSW